MTPECMDSNIQLGKAREKSLLTQRAAFSPQGTLMETLPAVIMEVVGRNALGI